MIRAVLVLAAATAVHADPNYEGALKGLWEQTDKDKDNYLSRTEFKAAAAKLDLDPAIFTEHGKSLDNFFDAINTGGAKGVSKADLAGAINKFPTYKKPLIKAFTNGAGEVPSGIPVVPSAMAEAKSKVTMVIEVAGKVSDLYPGTRKEITQYFADQCKVPTTSVIMTFLPKGSSRRRLQSGDGVKIEGTAFVADDAAAQAAQSSLPKNAAGFQAVPAFTDLSVTSATVEAKLELAVPVPEAAITGAVLLVLGIFLCFIASKCSRQKSKKAGVEGGCCQAGCCSFYAVKSWAFGEFVALCCIIGTVFFLYTRMSSLTNTIVGLLDVVVALATSTLSMIRGFASQLPPSIIQIIQDQKAQLQLLPFAVMGPGACCIIFLLFASLCPLSKAHQGSYCVSKCMIMLANIFLLVSFIFYIIFVALALVIQFAPPSIKTQINSITGLCDVLPATVLQLVADNKAGLDQLEAAGQPASSLTDLRQALTDVEILGSTIDQGCTHLSQLFVDIFNLFLPGLMCIVAIVFAMFVNNTLCCAEGCCKAPPPSGNGGKGGVEMNTVQNVTQAV